MQEHVARKLKEALAEKSIATRTTEAKLNQVLRSGRFKTIHESDTESMGFNDIAERRHMEMVQFGIPESGFAPEQRPVYGYVATAGVGNFLTGADDIGTYGDVEVVFKPSVRARTTAMVGDSLNDHIEGWPSWVDNPSWASAQVGRDGLDDFESEYFRRSGYVEAQIHNGVSVDDIEQIIFRTEPEATTRAELARRKIPWKVAS